jgi:hypothetical protein
MNSAIVRFLITALMSIVVRTAGAEVDQQFVPADWGAESNVGAGNDVDWAQTFTVGLTGTLTGIDIWVDRPAAVTMPLLYDIRTTLAGIPTEPDSSSNVLAYGSIDASMMPIAGTGTPRSGMTHIDISSASLSVTAGDVLAIVLRSDDPGTGCCGFTYSWLGDVPAGVYSAGNAYVRAEGGIFITWTTQNQDNAFRTYVDPIPEPSAVFLSMWAIGTVILACPVRRRILA